MSAGFKRAAERGCHTAFAALLLSAAPATACTLRLGTVQATPIAYDPFAAATTPAFIRVEVTSTDGDDCEGAVRLDDLAGTPLRSLAFDGDRGPEFRIELLTTRGVTPSTDPATASLRLSPDQPRLTVEWRVLPVRDTLVAPGEYQFPFRIDGAGGGFADGETSEGALALRSLPRAQVNLAGAAGRFSAGSDALTLDLGELAAGRTGRAFLQVRANTPGQITVESAGRGFLVNDRSAMARVPYSITIDGRPIGLTGVTTLPVAETPTLDGASLPIVVVVGEVRGAAAGRYSDTVTIDVSP